MKYRLGSFILGLSAIAVFSGCATETSRPDAGTTSPSSFQFEPTKSRAFLARDCLTVYLVGASQVVTATFSLSESPTSRVSLTVPASETNSITRFSGPNVAQYVLPYGITPPFPTTADYSRQSAIHGTIVCLHPPKRGKFEYRKKITVCLDAVDFGDGKLYEMKPIQFTVEPFPP